MKAADSPDWGLVASALARQGTVWQFAPAAGHFRNGASKRMIQMARHSLGHLLASTDPLDIHQFSTVLSTVSATINARPVGISQSQAGDLAPLTPGDLLTGRQGASHSNLLDSLKVLTEEDTEKYVSDMMRGKMAIFQAWRAEWTVKVFPTLLARAKWKKPLANVRLDTIGLLQYESKFGADTWKLARVVSVFPDDSGAVRTVEVQLGLKAGQQGGILHKLMCPIQRFCPLFHPDDQ